ncbi:MAG: hypothetical protein ACJ76J_28310 [Thermoanaerobaculia bacterium]
MASNLSVAETLAHLEAKIAHHKEQRELHASQEALHAEQKEQHDAEHRKAVERFEAFKAASAAVGELLVDVKPAPPPAPVYADVRSGGWRWVSKLMLRVVAGLAPDEVFGASRLIREIETRWGHQLRHPIQPRSVSSTLRRWGAEGRIHLVRDGKSHHESLYTKEPRGAGGR